jgi:general secretion pathway protein N
LSALSDTRERPPFAATRRPPPVVADSRPRPAERLPPRAVPPEQPPLKLIGTIVGEARGFGLFVDTATKDVVRLSTGSRYHGWLLRTVRERAVVMERNHLNQILELPTPPPVQPVTITKPDEPAARTDGNARLQHRPQRPPIDATSAYR